ncbi:hypothetical protein JCM8097_008486 [Rhodosporidiobolus ruineniae]
MTSWLPSTRSFFPFTFSSPAPTSSTTPDHLPRTPSPARQRRLPAPPMRREELASEVEVAPASGFKREREGSASGGGAVGGGGGVATDGADQAAPPSSQARKKRKGMLGTALTSAVDAAIFASALSYSAYRIWKSPPTDGDLEGSLRRLTLESRAGALPPAPVPLPIEAPPPYSETTSPRQPSSPKPAPHPASPSSASKIPRRVRHVHEPRPRLSSRSSSGRSISPIASRSSSSALSAEKPYDPFAALLRGPLPEFQPYNSPRQAGSSVFGQVSFADDDGEEQDNDDEEDGLEDDEEMRAIAARMKDLIETGRDALVARPKEWDERPQEEPASRPAPTSAALARARSAGALSGRHSLPNGFSARASPSAANGSSAFASSSSSRPPSSTSNRHSLSPLSPPPPRSPRTSSAAFSPSHARRQSVPSSFPSYAPSSASPSSSTFSPSLPPAGLSPSAASSSDMRRAATVGHRREKSLGGAGLPGGGKR